MELKIQFIQAITEGIELLNGEKFERLCTYFMSMVTDSECKQVGHNLYQKPVGYTDDIIKDARTVGQCGTEDNYFKTTKATDDIDGCIKNSPKCHTIYLFANKRATGSEYNALHEKIHISYSHYHIELYDAYRMANKIYEKRYNTRNVIEILAYLPKANQFYKIMPVSNILPSLPADYVSRKEEQEVIERLQIIDFLQVYGLSGIGKSLLAQAVALIEAKNYDTVLWFDGKEITYSNFSATYLISIGENVNLKYVLENFKVLLIVDNLNKDVSRFREVFAGTNKKGSKCIVTSLSRSIEPHNILEVTYLDEETSFKILMDTPNPPTTEQAKTLIGQIKGYPLLIDIAKRVVKNGDYTWDELVGMTDKTQLPDLERNEEFARRIIGKYASNNIELFNLMAYLDTTLISYDFFKEQDVVKVKNLIRCAILQQTNDFKCSVHFVVLQAIKRVVYGKCNEEKAKATILKYLAKHVDKRDAGLYTFTSIHFEELMNLQATLGAKDQLRHYVVLAIIYACDTQSDYNKYLALIDNLELDYHATTPDLSLIIERYEMKQREQPGEKGDNRENRKKQALSDIEELKSMLIGDKAHDALIYHHIGKWYFNMEENDKSEECLRKALNSNPDSFGSYLTLARLYNKKKDKDKFAEVFDYIFNDKILPSVPISVQLSMYGLLNAGNYSDLRDTYLDENLDRFAAIVYASLSERFSQTFHELSKLSGSLAYKHPDFYNRLCNGLPMPLDIDKNDQLRKNYGSILSAQYRYGQNTPEEKERILHRAELYLSGISFRSDFDRKILFDLYIASSQPDKAIELAATYENQEDVFMHQGLCKAYRHKNDLNKSLDMIQFSIDHEEKVYIGYKAAFRHDKAITLHLSGKESAKEQMMASIEMQPDKKIAEDWTAELQSWN